MSQERAEKLVSRLEVPVAGNDPATFVPYGIIRGKQAGLRTAVVAGVHGTELVTQDAALELWRGLDPATVRGELTVIFVADVLAAQSGIPGANPVDGRNLNRVWPGSEGGSFSERLAHRIWTELLGEVDALVDIHGGEWTEEVLPFGIVREADGSAPGERSRQVALSMGLPYLDTTQGLGTLTRAVSDAGGIAVALEVGGGGRRGAEELGVVTAAVRRALQALGVIDGEAAPATTTVPTRGSQQLRSSTDGVLFLAVAPGDKVVPGQLLGTILDFGGEPLEEVRAPRAGVILLRSLARVVREGSLLITLAWAE